MNYSAGFARIINIINVLVALAFAIVLGILMFSPMDTLKFLGATVMVVTVICVGSPDSVCSWAEKRGASLLRLAWLRLVALVTGGFLSIYLCFMPRAAVLGIDSKLGTLLILGVTVVPFVTAALVHVLTGGLGKAANYVVDGFKQEK